MRLVGVAVALLGAIALVAAACGGTSSSDKTSTAAAGGGVGGSQVTPVATSAGAGTTPSTSGSPTTAASGSPTGAASPATTGTASAGGSTQLTLTTASGSTIAFDQTTLNAPAGAQVTVTYNNMSSVTHNVQFFNGADASAPSLGMTQIATGPDTQTVSFTAPTTPGSYYYQCDVHPTQMHGMLVVK